MAVVPPIPSRENRARLLALGQELDHDAAERSGRHADLVAALSVRQAVMQVLRDAYKGRSPITGCQLSIIDRAGGAAARRILNS
jgi:hypothetical protein